MITWLRKLWLWIAGLFAQQKLFAVLLQVNQTTISGITIKENITMAIITNTQRLPLAVQAKDSKGNPAQIQGIPSWYCSDSSLAQIEIPNPDALSCVLSAIQNGTVTVTVSAQNLNGVTITSPPITIEIVSGIAITLSIITGTPEEQ